MQVAFSTGMLNPLNFDSIYFKFTKLNHEN